MRYLGLVLKYWKQCCYLMLIKLWHRKMVGLCSRVSYHRPHLVKE